MQGTTAHDRHVEGRPSLPTKARWRPILFGIGDFLFLVTVGMVATLVMHGMHQLGWNFAVTSLVGMAAAMLVQMIMAFCAAPLLGSIETMTPSMVVGMISPMSVCTLHMFGCESNCILALVLGAAVGAVMFVLVAVYGARVRLVLSQS